MAELGRLVSGNRQIEELRHIDKGNTYLESLNKDWNREFKGGGHPRHVLLFAGYEELAIRLLGPIVKLSSATPFADESMGFQEDHISIAKPRERNVLYRWVKAKLEESLEKSARQLVNGLVQQGLLAPGDVPQQITRTVQLLEGFQALAGTELEKVATYVQAGQFQAALNILTETEPNELQLIENIAQRRFTQAEIHELQFQMAQAATYYSQAVQLAPTNGWFRVNYGRFLIHTGDARAAGLQFQEAVYLSQSSHNAHLEGAALSYLGVSHRRLGQYSKAIEYGEQALAIHQKIGDVQGEGNDLGILSNAYDELGQYSKAIEYGEQALAIHRKIGDVQGEGNNLGNLGNAYKNLGQYLKAIKYHEEALAIRQKIGDVRGEATALLNLGNAYIQLRQYPKTFGYYEQALAIHRQIGNVQGEATTIGNIGAVYAELRHYSKAIEYGEQALAIHRKIGDVRGEGNDLGNLGNAYKNLGQYLTGCGKTRVAEGRYAPTPLTQAVHAPS